MTPPRVLDRIPHLDPRNLGFPIRALLAEAAQLTPRSFSWRCDIHLDQQREGACVGHGFAHDALARPVVRHVSQADAFAWYRECQLRDPWRNQPHDGTTVLAGAQVYVAHGRATGYRWAFGLADTILTLGHNGPVVLGVDWWSGMFDPDDDGWLHVTGRVEGGHCILAKGVRLVWQAGTTTEDKRGPDWLSHLDLDRSYALLHQSWGSRWGQGGDAKLALSGLAQLLASQGEVCVPVGRR